QIDYGTSKSDEASNFKHRKSVHELKADFESRRKEICNSTAEVSTACSAASKKRRSLAFNTSIAFPNPSSPPLPPPSHIPSSPSLQFRQRASAIEHLLSKNITSNDKANPSALSVSSDDRNLARRQHSLDSVASSNTSSSGHESATVSLRNPTAVPLIQQPKQPSAGHTIISAMRTVSSTHNPANEQSKTADGVKMPPPEPPVDYDSRSGFPGAIKLVNASESKSSHVSQGLRRLDNHAKVNASKNIADQTKKEARGRSLATNNNTAKVDNGKISSPLEMSNVNVAQVPNGNGADGLGERKHYARRTVTKKTRAYLVDGIPVTSTTYHLMSEDGSNNYKAKEDFQLRKSELQALKRLQKEEAHQFQDLAAKTEADREFQEKRFIQDMQSIQNHYDCDLELLSKQQKKQLEETERLQEEEFRMTVKRLKQEQDRDLRAFRETLKQEHKLLKHEMEIVPKADRKDVFRSRRDMLDVEHLERDRQFCEKQQQEYESALARLKTTHIENVVALEKHFLEQKHKMMRTREKSLLDMEERQLHEKHQIAKSQLKEIFLLQRSQMLIRHQKFFHEGSER
uniref:Uncharacterized protein n=1 Tax=Romanomermis culicivorax TaxID=13658 RepID=A0A915K0J5_ROMCU